MDLRLAYRIASLKPIYPDPFFIDVPIDYRGLAERVELERQTIQTVPRFCVDNVARFYASHDRTVWAPETDVPNWAPPFEQFFVEWNEPADWLVAGKQEHNDKEGQIGFLVAAIPVTEADKALPEAWRQFLGRCNGGDAPLRIPEDTLGSILLQSRWVLFCSQWASSSKRPLCGRPLWMGLAYFLFVSAEGRLIQRFVSGVAAKKAHELFGEDAIWSPIHVFGLALSFCHCKNVIIRESPVVNLDRWHRQTRIPALEFHTIDIDPMRQILRQQGMSELTGIRRALHICRGHFATYTPDSPLFGKYVGTYWRPDHVRGSKVAGVVVKDYSVNSPVSQETHS